MLAFKQRPVFVKGSAYGMRGSFVSLPFDTSRELNLDDYRNFCRAMNQSLGEPFMVFPKQNDHEAVISSIFQSLANLWGKTYHPYQIEVKRQNLKETPAGSLSFLVTLPIYLRQPAMRLIRFAMSATCPPQDYPLDPKSHWSHAHRSGVLKRIIDKICAGPPSVNTVHLLAEAVKMGVPTLQIQGDTWRLGLGKNSRITQATFTDQTNVLGVQMARNKFLMANLLTQNGLPNLGGQVAKTAEQAVKIAEKIGYPVVVKPLAKDGGVGVGCDIRNRDEVTTQVKRAQKFEEHVIVQKFVEAKDYRVYVFNGIAVSVVERIPGGVVGDGVGSIEALVEKVNQEPLRGPGKHLPLEPLAIDEEAERLMERQGYTRTTVLPKGVTLPLRSTANIASGGTPRALLEHTHPDNLKLAETAAKAFGLDYSGVDLLLPDAGTSYLESGGWVCEVNSQPHLGFAVTAHLFPMMLAQLIQGNGRIPITFILAKPDNEHIDKILTKLSDKFPGIGCVRDGIISVAGRTTAKSAGNCYSDLMVLFSNADCDAAVYIFNDNKTLGDGLPVTSIDSLIILDAQNTDDDSKNVVNQVLNTIGMNIDHNIMSVAQLPGLASDHPLAEKLSVVAPSKLPNAILKLAVQCDEHNRQGSEA